MKKQSSIIVFKAILFSLLILGSFTLAYASVPGCTDSTATNYNVSADTDNGSCIYTSFLSGTESFWSSSYPTVTGLHISYVYNWTMNVVVHLFLIFSLGILFYQNHFIMAFIIIGMIIWFAFGIIRFFKV